jgi:transposase
VAPPSKYSPEFKAEAVRLALQGLERNKPITETARELEVNSETLRSWVRKHEKEQEPAEGTPLSVAERTRLKELERRNRELEMENSFLKKAAAYFAKDAR